MTKQEVVEWHEDGARDEAYIDTVLAEVKRLWLKRPHLRLGQLVYVRTSSDSFNTPDEDWFDWS